MHHGQLNRRHSAPGNAPQPGGAHHRVAEQFGFAGTQAGRLGQRLHDGITGEFGVALPLQGVTLKAQAQKITLQLGQQQVLLPRQLAQMLAFLFAADAGIEHCHIDDKGWQAHPGRWPGVHLVVQGGAQGIVGREPGDREGVGVHRPYYEDEQRAPPRQPQLSPAARK